MNNKKTQVQQVRNCLLNSKFFIKEHTNNFMPGYIISISCKVEGAERKAQMIMFNEKDFTISNLKDKIDESLISNEPTVRHFIQEYFELDEILTKLYRQLNINTVLEG